MESLLLLFVIAGFYVLQNKMPYKGLSLIAVSPLIHPNGFYFLLAAVAYCVLSGRLARRAQAFTKSDAWFLAAVVLLWAGYAIYAGLNWQYFLNDMKAQFQRKEQRDILQAFATKESVRNLLLLVLGLAYGIKRKIPSVFLLALAGPAWVINRIGQEMWYQVFDSAFYALLTIYLLHIGYDFLSALGFQRLSWSKYVLPSALALCLLVWSFPSGRIIKPIGYPANMAWVGMRMPGAVPYVVDDDLQVLRDALNTLQSENGVPRVQFVSRADAFFFHDMDPDQIQLWHPLFHAEKADVYIVHISRYTPKWLAPTSVAELNRLGIDTQSDTDVLLRRDDTEAWYIRDMRR
jgi:hypothetical protein